MRFCSQGNSLRIENDILAVGAQLLKHFGCSFGGVSCAIPISASCALFQEDLPKTLSFWAQSDSNFEEAAINKEDDAHVESPCGLCLASDGLCEWQ